MTVTASAPTSSSSGSSTSAAPTSNVTAPPPKAADTEVKNTTVKGTTASEPTEKAGRGRDERGKFVAQKEAELTPEQKEPAAKEPPKKKWAIKTRAGERSFEDPDEMYAYASELAGSANLVEEAKKAAAHLEKVKQHLADGDFDALTDMGLSKKAAVEYLKRQLDKEREEAELTPEQKELREVKAKLKAIEDEKAAAARKEHEAKQAEETKAERERIISDINAVLDKTNLPRNTSTTRRIAQELMKMDELGYELPPEAIAKRIEAHALAEFEATLKADDGVKLFKALAPALRGILEKMDDDQLLSELGPELSKKFRLAELRRLDPTRFAAQAQPGGAAPTPPEGASKSKPTERQPDVRGHISQEEWDRMNRKRLRS
jgi:hypothetical protein